MANAQLPVLIEQAAAFSHVIPLTLLKAWIDLRQVLAALFFLFKIWYFQQRTLPIVRC